ncbi:MAG: hypothetical protein R3C26_19135, partial [Calditrichia bacterium]
LKYFDEQVLRQIESLSASLSLPPVAYLRCKAIQNGRDESFFCKNLLTSKRIPPKKLISQEKNLNIVQNCRKLKLNTVQASNG